MLAESLAVLKGWMEPESSCSAINSTSLLVYISSFILDFFLYQVALIWTLKDGVVKMYICTANTFTATSWWSERLSGVFSICGMKSSAWMSWPQSSTKCACSPRPWTRLLMASLGCLFSSRRSRHTCTDRNGARRRHEARKWGKTPLNRTVGCFGKELLTRGDEAERGWWFQQDGSSGWGKMLALPPVFFS